jgi:hypothetical protein
MVVHFELSLGLSTSVPNNCPQTFASMQRVNGVISVLHAVVSMSDEMIDWQQAVNTLLY